MKKLILFITAVFICLSVKAQQLPELETFTLKNGLKIYFLKYGKIEAITVFVVVNSGKKNETPGQQGYNGLVANLVFAG